MKREDKNKNLKKKWLLRPITFLKTYFEFLVKIIKKVIKNY